MDANSLNELIKNRRSIFPGTYTDQAIPKEIIEQILENANWAPNHKKTEPWRFKVYQGQALARLSEYLGNWYVANTPEEKYSEKKLEKTKKKPLQSSCVIAICMQRDPKESLPEWEEIAAVACAVQNMWLTCTAHDIGCYWSSPRSIIEATEFLDLGQGERCFGLFYMGYHNMPKVEGTRGDISEKVSWISE